MDAKKYCAVGIKRLWYGETTLINQDLTGALVAALLKNEKTEEVKNIHQDTWTLEESESSQDSYRNQLTKSIYRMGSKTMGEVTANWTIGQYDFKLKAEFLGGTYTATSWKRARGIVEIRKFLIILTEDGLYCVIPEANIEAHEGNADGALGIAIKGTEMEPQNEEISPEYWFDAIEVEGEKAEEGE